MDKLLKFNWTKHELYYSYTIHNLTAHLLINPEGVSPYKMYYRINIYDSGEFIFTYRTKVQAIESFSKDFHEHLVALLACLLKTDFSLRNFGFVRTIFGNYIKYTLVDNPIVVRCKIKNSRPRSKRMMRWIKKVSLDFSQAGDTFYSAIMIFGERMLPNIFEDAKGQLNISITKKGL